MGAIRRNSRITKISLARLDLSHLSCVFTRPKHPPSPTDKDLKLIKKQMIKIMNKGYPLRREEVTRAEAERRIKELNEPYKLEILESIKARLTGGESADCSAHP